MAEGQQPDKPQEYMSFNGLGRKAMIPVLGIPYMAALALSCIFMLGGVVLGFIFGPAGMLFALVALPVGFFIRLLCETDDRAIEILLLEVKWAVLKLIGGTARFVGGTLAVGPMKYGRRLRDVKEYFEESTGR